MIGSTTSGKMLLIPIMTTVIVAGLATLLLTIGARSPYTHANLLPRFDAGYGRTEQAFVGPPQPYRGSHPPSPSLARTDSETRGQALLVRHGCASCHGLEGRGGTVGPPIRGFTAADLRAKTDKGPGGMPAYGPGALPDDDLDAIAGYLKPPAR